jgi:hypothetical protein
MMNNTEKKSFKMPSQDLVIMVIFIGALLFLGYSLLMSKNTKDTNVYFIVLNDENITNSTLNMAQLHYECVQFCANKFGASGNPYITDCYKQCGILKSEVQ